MTMTRGTMLRVESTVDGESYDVPHGAGYGISTQITVDGTPGEQVIMDSVWGSIEEAGDLPVYVQTRLTYSGHEWPWSETVSKFDVEYQAVHMAEGSIIASIAAIIIYALPYLANIILVILGTVVARYLMLKIDDVGQWMDEHGPVVGTGIGVGAGLGVVLIGALILSGGNKR